MRFSNITVCATTSAATIRDTVDSVFAQQGIELEYIVIDGGSTDGTVEILRGYGDRIARIVSEPDEGIYDAMNKGVALAIGDVVGILNSDDFYAHDQVLSQVVATFESVGTTPTWRALRLRLVEPSDPSSKKRGASERAEDRGQGTEAVAAHVLNRNLTPNPNLKRPSSVDSGRARQSHAPTVDCVFGDLDYVDAEDTSRVVRAWRSKPY